MTIQARFQFVPGSRREVLAALYPFILAGAILPLVSILERLGIVPVPNPWVAAFMVVLVGGLVLLFLSAVVLGLPRWSLPYIGLPLALLNIFFYFGVLEGPIDRLYSDLFDRTSLFGDILLEGALWLGLTMAMCLLVFGSTVSPWFKRFRNDWTLLCFMIYGAVPFIIRVSFDPYVGEEPYELAGFLILTVGAWIYLRSDDPQRRFWALFAGVTGSILITAAGKAILIPSQGWPVLLGADLVQSEVTHTLITGGWLLLIMLLPLLLKGLSEKDEPLYGEDSRHHQ